MRLLNPNITFTPSLVRDPELPGRFYRPVGGEDWEALKDTAGKVVPFKSEAEAYYHSQERAREQGPRPL